MISVRGLAKEFAVGGGRVAAIKNLNIEVAEGEFFVIVGASGSGKTTLLRAVAGLEVPDRGTISIGGRVVSSDDPPAWIPSQQRKLGMVFQSYAVWPHLTVYQNVALPLTDGTHRVRRGEVEKRAREALRLVQLDQLAERSATLLSGGQQQRVALARAIAVNPGILLMDEPLSNLDARLREEVRGKIRELAKQLGSTVLYVTHDQVEAMAMADRIGLMQAGELLQVGGPAELYHNPATTEVADFFGTMNWLEGKIVAPGVAETAIGPLRCAADAAVSADVLLGFRPECVELVQAATADKPNVFPASLTARVFLGDQSLLTFAVADRAVCAKCRAVDLDGGGPLRVRIDPADVLIFSEGRRLGRAVAHAPSGARAAV
jgi:iron(III) transport system ATP-binding protein